MAAFEAGINKLEERVGTACHNSQIVDHDNDQQRGSCIEQDLLNQPPLPLGLVQ
jgi:hypothetical protein